MKSPSKVTKIAIPALIVVLIILYAFKLESYIVAGFSVLVALILGYFAFRFIFLPPREASTKDRIVMGLIASFAATLLLLFSLLIAGILSFFVVIMFGLVGGFSVSFGVIIADRLLTRWQLRSIETASPQERATCKHRWIQKEEGFRDNIYYRSLVCRKCGETMTTEKEIS